MNELNPKVDGYLKKLKQWRDESQKLRAIALSCGLSEELKWGKPCFALQGSNVVLIQGFKAYVALLFFKGALLKDPMGILKKIGENTQAGRQIRFTDVEEITRMKMVLKAYVKEAIAVEKAGLKVRKRETSDFAVPSEFQSKLDEMPELKSAFAALTPGRQRGYLLHFSGAKQSATRESRVAKCMEQILAGKGLDD